MNCLKCERTAELDRVVVDILTGTEVGGLCERCLEAHGSPVFQDDIWREESACAVCAETPQYEIPLIDCLIRYADNRPDEVEYAITDATLRLCTTHLREFLMETPEELQIAEALVSQ
jgi:hypothetical protein